MMTLLLVAASLNTNFIEQGKALGKSSVVQAKDIIKKAVSEGKSDFDANQVLDQVKAGDRPKSEILDWLNSEEVRKNERENKYFHEEESFLKGEVFEKEQDFTIETCMNAEKPLLMSPVVSSTLLPLPRLLG